MGLFNRIKDKKNRNSVVHPPSGPSSVNSTVSTAGQSNDTTHQSPIGAAQTNQASGHSSTSLIPPQESISSLPIPAQSNQKSPSPQVQPPQQPLQQPPWGYSASPNPPAQGQFWPQPGQYAYPPQAPYGQPIYILQNGQLVPIFPGQQMPAPPATVGSPNPSATEYNYPYNQNAQSPASAPFSSSPYQIPPLPVPPTAPPSGSSPYLYNTTLPVPSVASSNSNMYSDLTASPVSPVSEFSQTTTYSQPVQPPPIELPQNTTPKSVARKPVPGVALSTPPSATPPPPQPATLSTPTTASVTNDLGSMKISETQTPPQPPKVQVSPQMEQKVEFLKNQGNSMVEAKNFDQAVMFYSMALDYNPDSVVCLSNRSMAYTKLKPPKMKEAQDDAEAATKADPTYWKGWSRLGDVLLSLGNSAEAVDAYNKAVQVGGTAVGQNTKQSLANAKRAMEQKGKTPTTSASPVSLTTSQTASKSATSIPITRKPSKSTPTLFTTTKTPTAKTSTPPNPLFSSSVSPVSPPKPPAAPISTASTSTTSPFSQARPPLNTQTTPAPAPAPARTAPPPVRPTPAPSTSTNTPAATTTSTAATANTPTSPSANAPARSGQTASGLPAFLEEAVANVEEVGSSEAPPAYAPNPNSTDPTIRHMSQQAVYSQVIELRNTLLVRNKGSFVIKPYTAVGNIDAVRIEFVGMTTQELTPRELGVHPDQHPSFSGYFVNSLLYPGCTLIDLDMEVSKIGEGRFPGTYSVSGYSEVYRAQQLEAAPILPITLSSVHSLPEITVDQIVSRLTVLKYNRLLPETNMQMYASLRKFLGPDPYPNQTDADKANLRNQITDICYVLNRVDATKYVDISNCRHLTNNTLGTVAQGVGLKNFLFQILLGCELLVRLLKEPINASYTGLISHNISANLVISDLWMQNIDTRRETTPAGLPRHLLISLVHQRQCEGLIRFAETLKWPYMDEARNYIEGAYNDLITGKAIGFDMCDWLFGLVRPGKLFRHLIMNCLVYSSPGIRDFQGAPTFTCGLVLHNRSYWPRRSVLGGVLGGLRNLTTVCGWVGPAPKADGVVPGWCQVDARKVTIPIPCTKSQRTAEELEEARIGPDGRVMNAEEQISDLADIAQWAVPTFPARSNPENKVVTFKAIRLMLQQDQAITTTLAPLKIYRAAVDFDISGTQVSYTLYSNPTFVAAHPCVGSHLAHRTETKAIRKTIIPAVDLKDTYLQYNSLLVIDATLKGEEVLARAWCSERGCNAVVWRGDETCFACAALMTMSTNGLGFNVLIRSM
ncbi:hypothetical protein AA313_de0203241 [Arthrobotrys entomopaga]|nr:hypothetical protein AA313_de0203241 [Arthrobotrys entomopaga]